MTAIEIICLLEEEYGNPSWQTSRDPLSELIRTILSQHTSDANSGRAFEGLRASLPSWEEVLNEPVEKVAESIWVGGLARVKAPRIKAILQRVWEERGSFDLGFLGEFPVAEAKAWLRRLPGVGPKTVGCVLLFSLRKPVLPVDTHVYRVTKRLGLIDSKVSAEQAHELLESLVPPGKVYSFHVNMIAHGRRVCKAQRPRCGECVLIRGCPSSCL